MISSAQIRAARGLLNWSQPALAEAAGVSLPTIKRMEGKGPDRSSNLAIRAVIRAFEDAGIEFVSENGGGEGVRFRQRKTAREPAGA